MAKIVNSDLDDLLETEDDPAEGAQPERPLSDNEIESAYANLAFRVVYQNSNYFLPQIRDLIKNREIIDLRPEYQRRLRWSTKQKSLLIESLLLNIPIPPIYLYESDLARYEVMDGQQRLNAIHEFLENDVRLFGLEKLKFLNGKNYARLPPKLRRSLDRASIAAIVLLQESKSDASDPYLVRRYVFERLNTGGKALNPQEMRNSIYRGPFNDLIVSLARNEIFCEIFDIPKYTETDDSEYYENPDRQRNNLYRTMGDCQIVLRFFALLDDVYIKGSMRSILDACMQRNRDAPPQRISEFRSDFEGLIAACSVVFGTEAFLLPEDTSGNRRVSVALYDAVMVSLYRRRDSLDQICANGAAIASSIASLIEGDPDLITGKANTAAAIRQRIAALTEIIDKNI